MKCGSSFQADTFATLGADERNNVDLILQRGTATDKSIPGEMFIGGTHACFTLERPEVAIPSGR